MEKKHLEIERKIDCTGCRACEQLCPVNCITMKEDEEGFIFPFIDEEKCKQCLLCVPVCPDSAIPVKEYKRQTIDYDHCKGCGICVKACPFGAIKMEVKK